MIPNAVQFDEARRTTRPAALALSRSASRSRPPKRRGVEAGAAQREDRALQLARVSFSDGTPRAHEVDRGALAASHVERVPARRLEPEHRPSRDELVRRLAAEPRRTRRPRSARAPGSARRRPQHAAAALAIAEPRSTSVRASMVVIVAVPGRRAVSTRLPPHVEPPPEALQHPHERGAEGEHSRAKLPIACATLNGSDSVAIAM